MKEEKERSLSLFSAETLDSIAMAEVLGGADNCNGGNCVQRCGCNSNNGTIAACPKVNNPGVCTKAAGCKDEGPVALPPDDPTIPSGDWEVCDEEAYVLVP